MDYMYFNAVITLEILEAKSTSADKAAAFV